jgi:hypothetical protein
VIEPAVNIARCPTHGLHGERDECHVCGGPVEQVAMIRLVDHEQLRNAAQRDRIFWATENSRERERAANRIEVLEGEGRRATVALWDMASAIRAHVAEHGTGRELIEAEFTEPKP